MKNYTDANNFFKMKKKTGAVTVPVETDMLLVYEDRSTYGLTLGGTPIIKYYRDGTIMLIEDDCGTAILRSRLNKYSPDCMKVTQRKFCLYVKFYDVTVPLNGTLIFNPAKQEICNDPTIDMFFN